LHEKRPIYPFYGEKFHGGEMPKTSYKRANEKATETLNRAFRVKKLIEQLKERKNKSVIPETKDASRNSKATEKRLNTVNYEAGRKSPTFHSTVYSPLNTPTMSDPVSPTRKPTVKVELDFRRMSPSTGNLKDIIRKLA